MTANCLIYDQLFWMVIRSLLKNISCMLYIFNEIYNFVFKFTDSRAKEFLLTSISCPPGTDLVSLLPASLKTLQRQMFEIALLFSKLVRHNRSVYGPYYSQIIANLLQLPRWFLVTKVILDFWNRTSLRKGAKESSIRGVTLYCQLWCSTKSRFKILHMLRIRSQQLHQMFE